MFVVTVKYKESSATIVWENEKLSGDQWAVDLLKTERSSRSVISRPSGPHWEGKEKRSALATIWLMQEVFTDIILVAGKVPALPRVPKGAKS